MSLLFLYQPAAGDVPSFPILPYKKNTLLIMGWLLEMVGQLRFHFMEAHSGS